MSPTLSSYVVGSGRRAIFALTCALVLAPLGRVSAAEPAGFIDSGSRWLDTDGKMIDAHGGGLLRQGDTYYWYGEMKAGRTELPECNASWGGTRVAFAGVSCYASTDLQHWRLVGNVLPVAPGVPELQPDRVVERPKVIYHRGTDTFVMWMHIDSMDYREARTGVAVAKSPGGPFRFLGSLRPNAGVIPEDMPAELRESFRAAQAAGPAAVQAWTASNPEWRDWARDFAAGHMARDMGLFVDDDGTAYQFYASEENRVMHVSQLSPDYTRHAGRYRRMAFDSREGPAPFKWRGRYYLFTSACTGWNPNPTHVHSAATILGEWTDHGSAFQDKGTAAEVSYLSQSTFVQPLGGDEFLYMADRWNKEDLAESRYIWLPVETTTGTPRLRWRQTWVLDAAQKR